MPRFFAICLLFIVVTRSVADVATSPAVQEVALQSQGHTAKEIAKGVARR